MKATIKDGKLILEIDLTEPKLSKSGKMSLVASTGGWIGLNDEEEPLVKEGKFLRANIMVGFYTKSK